MGGLDKTLDKTGSSNSGFARLRGGKAAPPLGVVKEGVVVLIALVRRHRRAVGAAVRHRRAVGAAVRRAVGDEVPGAIEEETGPAAVRRVPQAFWMRFLYMPLVRLASSL